MFATNNKTLKNEIETMFYGLMGVVITASTNNKTLKNEIETRSRKGHWGIGQTTNNKTLKNEIET